MNHHTHIIAYYLHMAEMAKQATIACFTEGYFIGRAFFYADF